MSDLDPNTVKATEFGKVRLFSTELDPEDASAITAQNIHRLLGQDIDLDPNKVEVIASKALDAIGLRTYLTSGYGIAAKDLQGKAAALDALTGLIVLIPTSAFKGQDVTLDPNPALRFIGLFSEETAAPPSMMPTSKSAEGTLPPPDTTPPPVSNHRRSWIGALGALIIAAILVLTLAL